MSGIDLAEIGRYLGIGSGQQVVWSLFLYVIFFLALITLFQVPDKNMVPTLLIAGVLMAALVVKLNIGSDYELMGEKDFGPFVLNAAMLSLPLIAAGMTRKTKQKKNPAPFAILTALTAGLFFFLYWALVQRA